jgi:hypothetical protein
VTAPAPKPVPAAVQSVPAITGAADVSEELA